MDVFKKLVVVRRRNHPSGSVVSDDGVDDGNFCYHRQDDDIDAEMVGEDRVGIDGTSNGISGNGGSSSSLYGRRRHSGSPDDTRPPITAVVTSNKFDSEETFSVVARAMIRRYQHQDMSERETILGTIENDDDLRAFIEALDQKFIVLTTQNTDGMDDVGDDVGDDTFSEIVFKTRSIFDATLKAMWREKELSSSSTLGMIRQHRDEMVADHDEYRKRHPKTPKNLRMSPMRTSSYNYKNHGIISQSESLDSACSEGSNNSTFRPFKRPRRWFFPQNKSERLVTPLYSCSATKTNPAANNKPFPIKAALLKFHFDFGVSSSINSKKNSLIFGDLGRGPKTVQSLQLDGISSSYASMGDGNGSASTSYIPPTSPIRKVSIEMKANGDSVEMN